MNAYHREQLEALLLVRTHLAGLPADDRRELEERIGDYLAFRAALDAFLGRHFGAVCTQSCYQSQRSACCSREGIVTFFADVVVNVLVSTDAACDRLAAVLAEPNEGFKCVYLGRAGCLWRVKPLVCAMFLCEPAAEAVFGRAPSAAATWQTLQQRARAFRWPDRPVLFDELEAVFMAAGRRSSLMYLHNSPGLLRVKQRAAAQRRP